MFYILAIVLLILFLSAAIKILREYERGVVFRLGRVIDTKGPGLIIIIPVVDKLVRVSLRLVAMDVPPQDVITKDNVSVKVNAVIYFRVMEPNKAVIEVENYLFATSQLAQTTLRSVCGQSELDELLSERDKINTTLQAILDKHTDPWGITWPNRRRQNGSGGQRSSMPRASFRPPPGWRMQPARSRISHMPSSCVTFRPYGRCRLKTTQPRCFPFPSICLNHSLRRSNGRRYVWQKERTRKKRKKTWIG